MVGMTEQTERITSVELGDTFTDDAGKTWEITASCAGGDDYAGHWYCTTHNEHFTNNMTKDGHCSDGRHTLAWFCHEHGTEVP